MPLTAILLLFELTRDYTILLPTLGAVGLSYWVSIALDPSGKTDSSLPANPTAAGPPTSPRSALEDVSTIPARLGPSNSW